MCRAYEATRNLRLFAKFPFVLKKGDRIRAIADRVFFPLQHQPDIRLLETRAIQTLCLAAEGMGRTICPELYLYSPIPSPALPGPVRRVEIFPFPIKILPIPSPSAITVSAISAKSPAILSINLTANIRKRRSFRAGGLSRGRNFISCRASAKNRARKQNVSRARFFIPETFIRDKFVLQIKTCRDNPVLKRVQHTPVEIDALLNAMNFSGFSEVMLIDLKESILHGIIRIRFFRLPHKFFKNAICC